MTVQVRIQEATETDIRYMWYLAWVYQMGWLGVRTLWNPRRRAAAQEAAKNALSKDPPPTCWSDGRPLFTLKEVW